MLTLAAKISFLDALLCLFYSFYFAGDEAKQKVVRIVDKQGTAVTLKKQYSKVCYRRIRYISKKRKKNALSYLSLRFIKQAKCAENLDITNKIKYLKATEKHGIM